MKNRDVAFLCGLALLGGGLIGAQFARLSQSGELREAQKEIAQYHSLREELVAIYARHKADPPRKILGVNFETKTGSYRLDCNDSGNAAACRLTATDVPKSQ